MTGDKLSYTEDILCIVNEILLFSRIFIVEFFFLMKLWIEFYLLNWKKIQVIVDWFWLFIYYKLRKINISSTFLLQELAENFRVVKIFHAQWINFSFLAEFFYSKLLF